MFKRGDVVCLNSGGHWMTVEDVEANEITVVWFDDMGGLGRETFVDDMLTHQNDYNAGQDEEDPAGD